MTASAAPVALRSCAVALVALCLAASALAQGEGWTARLDGGVRFYQTTELGAIVVGTEKSLYAIDGATGETLWRRRARNLDETDVAAVPGTDVLLVSSEDGDKSRLEAVDLLGGGTLWRTGKVRGGVMAIAADAGAQLLAVVTARDARGEAKQGFRRKARIHVFDFASGRELWERETGEIEMMPARWTQNGEVPYTLDNYRPPFFLDDRLWLFYEGVTSYDARTGDDRERDKFAVNEDGLALTEADPAADDERLYVSGRGRVRAISRRTGAELWRADDLGRTPELVVTNDRVVARTGGSFVRLKDGESVERGPYGLSALDPRTGKTLWRYKGADKGITNFALAGAGDADTQIPYSLFVADRDELLALDPATGERLRRVRHRVKGAAFVIPNERGEIVVGGREELAAFDADTGAERWRARHEPPGRSALRVVTGIAARAAALYFRYGGAATTALRGVHLARVGAGLRWSGLAARLSVNDLTTLAANRAQAEVASRLTGFGLASRLARARSLGAPRSTQLPSAGTIAPRPSIDVEERLLDRIDPANQLERFSRFLLRRERLAALRGRHMYFYTDLRRAGSRAGGRGLAGVDVETGRTERFVPVGELDPRFLVDETEGLLYTADDNKLRAYAVE